MAHLERVVLVLAIIVVGFVAAFIAVRSVSGFERFGFYRQRNDIQEWVDQPLHYAESSQCENCHEFEYAVWERSKHSTVNCENCHGPAQAHIEGGASLAMDTSREFCGLCHEKLLARDSNFPQVDLEEHGGQAKCVDCHDRHDPGIAVLPPHELQGRLGLCLLCHEEAGLVPYHQDHLGRTVETCLDCHRGLRPPHLLDASREGNCLICHGVGAREPFPEDHAGRSVDTCLFCHHAS